MSFSDVFQGKMYGVLSWQKFETLLDHLRANPTGWYVWKCDEDMPAAAIGADDFVAFLADAEVFLRKQDRTKRCGFVYLDDANAPELIKVFHPRKMGSGCGCSGEPVLPYWTLSKMLPAPIMPQQSPACTIGQQ